MPDNNDGGSVSAANKTTIEMMLDRAAEWKAVPAPSDISDGLPYATHEGALRLFGHQLRCYRLNTGQTVFDVDDVAAFFTGAEHAK